LPDENYLFEQYDRVDVDGVCEALSTLRQVLAERHLDGWWALYAANAPQGPFDPGPAAMARRSLRHAALGMLAPALDGEAATALLDDHYASADNLTERQSALRQITRHPGLAPPFRQRLLDDFHTRWRNEALVVDTWFSLQAASPLATAADVAALTRHADFDARNPNKLRAVYGAFARQNHRNFHAADGSGYDLLGDAVADIDGRNPAIAARLAMPLTRWRRVAGARSERMRGVLEQLRDTPSLSRDLYEVVTKSLS
jgi:aminopeptidase N